MTAVQSKSFGLDLLLKENQDILSLGEEGNSGVLSLKKLLVIGRRIFPTSCVSFLKACSQVLQKLDWFASAINCIKFWSQNIFLLLGYVTLNLLLLSNLFTKVVFQLRYGSRRKNQIYDISIEVIFGGRFKSLFDWFVFDDLIEVLSDDFRLLSRLQSRLSIFFD